jgi:hypothetical protein
MVVWPLITSFMKLTSSVSSKVTGGGRGGGGVAAQTDMFTPYVNI